MKKTLLLTLAASLLLPLSVIHAVEIQNLRCEYLKDPLGIDAAKPRLSWIIKDDERGQKQTAFQILVASSPEILAQDQGDLWDSGKVACDRSVQVEYAGKPLGSQARCHWKVRVWDKDGKASAWSEPANFSVGLPPSALSHRLISMKKRLILGVVRALDPTFSIPRITP